jgi:hypothetical protein
MKTDDAPAAPPLGSGALLAGSVGFVPLLAKFNLPPWSGWRDQTIWPFKCRWETISTHVPNDRRCPYPRFSIHWFRAAFTVAVAVAFRLRVFALHLLKVTSPQSSVAISRWHRLIPIGRWVNVRRCAVVKPRLHDPRLFLCQHM